MNTYFLILKIRRGERPILIKQCRASSKVVAAVLFADRLNSFLGPQKGVEVFLSTELVSDIKRIDELTAQERSWIAEEEIEFLEL